MNKTELIAEIAVKAGLAKKDAEKAIEILKANGEDAYLLGEIIEGDDGVVLC